MFAFKKARRAEADKFRKALDRSLAIVEFDPAGQILDANDNFCKVMGYAREEILGKSHRLFVDPAYVQSAAYREFWAKLGRGQFDDSQYKRIGKNGREIWIQASYNPILNARGVVERVVKVEADITPAKLRNVEFEAKLNAISLVQAIIEFTPEGEILTANENFLEAMGYALDEIRGRHHRVFVDAKFAQSPEYAAFWAKLKRGEFVSDTFRRLGKGGAPILLQASYNPIFDLNGKVMKIVKFATDISDLADLGAGLSQLAAGDMERPIAESFRPMFEPIRHDFNRAQSRLRSTLGRIVDCAAAVADGGKRVSSASEDLARRTEQQAVSLEETAAALGGVNQTVKKTASGAGQARDVTSETRGDAERSGEIVRRAIDAMGKIEGSSQRIGQIIGVIDEIAFQTNLLALNAGVEAARAGEAGRGFAVVASEVRALAQRSAGAAKEIKQLVSASTEEVGEGVKFVGATGESLARIIAKVGKINTLIAEIASGAEGQSTALHDVNAAVTTMDRAVQQNAAVAQETTAASRSLLEEAETLAELAREFRIGREKSFHEPPRPASRHFAA